MHVNVFDPQRFDVGLHTMAHPATVTPLAKLCQSLFGGLCPPRSGDGNQGFYRAALLSVQFGVHRNTLLRWQSFIVSVLAVVVSILVIVAKLATYGFEQFTDEVMGPTFITEITLYCVCAVASLAWAVVALIPPLYDTCIGAETTRLSAAKKTLVKNRISFKKRLLQRIVLNVFSSIWLGTVMGANLISKGGYSQTLVVIAALYSFFPVRVIDMHFLLLLSWFIYLVATLSVDREDVSEYWRYPKQLTRIVALGALAGVVAVDTHLRDFSMATKYILKRRFEAKKSKLEKDELRAKELLHNMLPPQVLRALEDGEPVEAEVYPSVTVIFIQLCDFESMSHGLRPADLVKILNVIFSRFDDIVKRHSVYKVETVGEVYMAVVGVPTRIQNHAQVAAACALDMLSSMRELQILIDKAKIKTRDNRLFDSSRVMVHIGMNSGPVNAGVVGLKSPRYKLFGDTVNTASRMESTCAPGEVQCSAATAEILQNSFYLVPRLVDVQGKGEMKTAIITGMMEERLELVQEATRSDSIAFVTFSQSKKRIGIVAPKPSPHFDPAEFVRRIYHYSALRRGEKDGGYTTEVSVLGTRQDRKRWLSPPLISHAARDRLRSWLERARELIQQQRLSGLYVSAEERVKQRLLMVGSGSDLSDERDALLGARDEIVSAVTCCETGCPARTRELLALVAKQIYFHARRFTYGLVDSDPKHIEQMDKLYTTFIDSHQARWMKGSRICTICYLIFICLIEWPYHWILNHDASVANMIAKESSGLPTLKHHMFIVHTFIGPTLTLFAFYTFVAENYYANHEAKGESAGPPLLSTKCNRIVAAVFSIVVAVEVLFIAEHNNRSGGILDDSFVMFFVIWNFHITITQLNIRILISAIALLLYAVKMWIMLGNVSSNFIGLVAFAIVSIVPMVISRHYSQYTFVQQDQIQNQAQQLAKIAEKSTRILRSVLPAKVARDPRLGKSLIADQFDQATVLFTDLKGFTQFSAELTPRQLVDFLNLLYSVRFAFAANCVSTTFCYRPSLFINLSLPFVSFLPSPLRLSTRSWMNAACTKWRLLGMHTTASEVVPTAASRKSTRRQ